MRTAYENLGLPENASYDQIEAAYHARWTDQLTQPHPVSAAQDCILQALKDSFQLLIHPLSRQEYDLFLDRLRAEL